MREPRRGDQAQGFGHIARGVSGSEISEIVMKSDVLDESKMGVFVEALPHRKSGRVEACSRKKAQPNDEDQGSGGESNGAQCNSVDLGKAETLRLSRFFFCQGT